MATHRILYSLIFATISWAFLHSHCAARSVTWIGGNGAWEDNHHWTPDHPDGFPLQPFDEDDVFIPSGVPMISQLEGINTLDVSPGAGIANNGVLSIHNGAWNDGLITFGTDGQIIIGAGALAGAGEIVLADSIDTNATIQGAPHSIGSVTHAATLTIFGEGTVAGKWINDGLIRAEETSGDASARLTISGTMTNNGVIRSSATGTILLESVTLTMGGTGELIADGQSIQLSAATIVGGSIDAINGARFVHTGFGTTVFSGVTINGDFDVLVNNAGVTGTGTGITNNGTMTIDNLGVANGQLHMDAGSTLDGTGQVILNRANDSTHLSGSFTHGADHTIRGVGRFHAAVVNNGSILAEPRNGGSLLRVVGNAITNNNLMQANDGATLRLEQQVAITQGTNGRIRAADGGRVELQDFATITGGKLQTEGTGLIVDASASVLNNVTNEGDFHVLAGSTTRVNTTLINNGTITVNPAGVANPTALEFSSDTVLSGTGTIVLNQTLNSARITSEQSNQDITQETGHTIRGAGWIANGFFGDGRFINHGHLEGNSAAEPLEISARLSGSGTLKNVRIGGFGASHTLGEAGTTTFVPVEGLYEIAGSVVPVLIDLAGTTPGTSYDQLNSTGPVMFTSTTTRLEVSIVDGFLPSVGDMFNVVTTSDAITGTFGAVILPAHIPNYSLTWKPVQYTGSDVILEVLSVAPLFGDYDADGVVDAADYTVWRDTNGTSGMGLAADGNGDNTVDAGDYNVWRTNFGATAALLAPGESPGALSAGESLGAVPEPTGVAIAVCVLFASIHLIRNRGIQCATHRYTPTA